MDAIFGLEQIGQVAKAVWALGKKHKVWAFHAEMGTGKTTFIHALCEVLGVTDAISSPTFAIINQYESKEAGVLLHMDWYRLKDEEEAKKYSADRKGQIGTADRSEKIRTYNILQDRTKKNLYLILSLKA